MMPLRVTKLRSTTSGVEVGLKSAMNNELAPVVVPLGKNHCREVLLWHGASAHPAAPWTVWDTATPPPDSMTTSDSHVPDFGAGRAVTDSASPATETRRATVAPVSVTPWMVAAMGREPVLVR